MRQVRSQNLFNRVAGGILIVLISLFCALSLFGAFAGVGDMVESFMLGIFGFSAYAYSIGCTMLGLAMLFGLRVTLPSSKILKYFSLFALGLLALHIFSSSAHILGRTYGEYVSACFDSANTAGGALFAAVSYPLMKALTNAGALIAVCLLFLVVSFAYFYPLIKSEVTYKTVKSKTGAKIGAQKQPVITDFSSISQNDGSGAKLYRVDIDAAPFDDSADKKQKKPKGADGYNPLFPNERGHIEDDVKIPENAQPFSESGLAKKILLSQQFDEEAYKKYVGGLGSSAIGSPSAPYATQKRIQMDGRLGIDRTGSGLRAEAGKRFTFDEDEASEFPRENPEEISAENSKSENDVGTASELNAHLDFGDKKDLDGISIPELRERSQWSRHSFETPKFKIDDLKQDEIKHFRDLSSQSEEDIASNRGNADSRGADIGYSAPIEPIKTREIATPEISAGKSGDAVPVFNAFGNTLKNEPNVEKDTVEAEIVEDEKPKIQPSVMPPVGPRFGSEKLRDAVARAASEPVKSEQLSKSERLERLEKLRAARLERNSQNGADSNSQKFVPAKSDAPRAAQITIDESIEKTIVKSPYVAPPLSLLLDADPDIGPVDDFEKKKEILVSTLASFNINAEVTDVVCGPTFSLYILQVTMPRGKTINWISVLDHDIAMKMEEVSVRILAPIPGKNAVGIEVPNKKRRLVRLKEILNSPKFNDEKSPFTFALGKNLYGDIFTADIKKLPHLLIAGATGAGKSCCINSLIVSLLYKATPDDLRMIMIDPKRVELKVYEKIPHLLMDEIIVDVDKAIKALQWVIKEMDRRTEFFSKNSYRDIDEYNYYGVKDGFPKMPRIAIIIDELADLMDLGKKAVEDSINRLARLARATGIHLIVATQRPSVDVISGTIKNNLPTRIAFKVTSGPDSKTVLDGGGADKLLGNGDMLYMRPSSPTLDRIQGAFISGEEVRNVVKFIREHNEGYFDEKAKQEIFAEEPPPDEKKDMGRSNRANELPIEFFKALQIGLNGELISVTLLQRRLRIGFPKAGNIVDQLAMRKYIGEADGSNKGRKVLITHEQFEELLKEHNLTEDDLY